MFEAEEGPEAGEAVQNPRKLLQKKRSSLAHQPDPGTLDRKESVQQQPEAVYEFQKVRYVHTIRILSVYVNGYIFLLVQKMLIIGLLPNSIRNLELSLNI